MFDFRQFFQGGDAHEHPESQQSDPEKYPRSAEITSTEFLMTIEAMQANDDRQTTLFIQAREIGEEISIVKAERQIMETKFWRAIREQYPHVVTEGQCGMGYRKHDGKLFIVSWGDEENKRDHPTTQEENQEMAYKEVKSGFFNKRNEEAQARKTGGGNWESWKPVASPAGTKAARNVIRFMPPHENMPDDGFVEGKLHFLPEKDAEGRPVLGKNGQPIPIGIGCLAYYGKDCPACNHVDRLYKSAKGEENADAQKKAKDAAYSVAAKLRFIINVVDIDHPEKGVQRYAFGPDVEKAIRACWYDDEGEFRNISHPKTGRDIIMLVTKKQGTTFNEYVSVKAKDTATALQDMAWLEQITDLSQEVREPSLADMELALKGTRPGGDKTKAAAPVEEPKKSKPKPAPEPEPEPEEEEEETPAPAPKKKTAPVEAPPKTKRQPIPEPEPEAEEEEEESDPYAAARKMIEKSGIDFTPLDITPEQTESIKKPTCYTKETELSDPACQGCRVLLPCLTAKLMAEE